MKNYEIGVKTLADCVAGLTDCPRDSLTMSVQIKNIQQNKFVVNVRTRKGAQWKDLFDRHHDITVIGDPGNASNGDILRLQGTFSSIELFLSRSV